MQFEYSDKVKNMQARLLAFMDEHIYPNEARFFQEIADNRAKGNAWVPTKIVEELKPKHWLLVFGICSCLSHLVHPKACLTWNMHRCAKSWDVCLSLLKFSIAQRPTQATWKPLNAMPAKNSKTSG